MNRSILLEAMARVKPRQRLAEAEKEKTIAMATKAVQRSCTHAQALQHTTRPMQKLSIRAAAEAYGIGASTLRNRLRGAVPHRAGNIEQQLLTPPDEKGLLM